MITFTCPACKVALQLPDEYVNKEAKCSKCGTVFAVPIPPPLAEALPPRKTRAREQNYNPNKPNVVAAILWSLCILYVGFAMLAVLAGVGLNILPHIIGPFVLCYAVDRVSQT